MEATSDPAQQLLILASDSLFDGIINLVSNVYKWNYEKKKSFYSALSGVKKFGDELKKLQPAEDGGN